MNYTSIYCKIHPDNKVKYVCLDCESINKILCEKCISNEDYEHDV